MVWFQCEDCGDNLKKPKLPTHFRVCSAYKLSCIDCGQVFGQHDVESHTQCISEAEKYGPKGVAKTPNGTNAKPKNESKPKPEVDINVGLSERPPWFCSLCNTKATSKQALLLHADGKKHRGKARAFHASKQQPNGAAETKDPTENNAKNEAPESKGLRESKDDNSSEAASLHDGSGVENTDSKSNKKRKLEDDENSVKKAKSNATNEDAKSGTNNEKDFGNKNIKWKKLITSALKSNPDAALKFKKLTKLIVKSLEESGFAEDKKQVSKVLEQKVNSSSKFVVDGKYVRLATTS